MQVVALKHVMSISIGSSARNKRVEVEILGEKIILERIGTDGNKQEQKRLFEEYDGKVDAFGVGGTDLQFIVENKIYPFKDGKRMVQNVRKTPVADGSYIKTTLESRVAQFMEEQGIIVKGKRVMMPSAVDRYGLAKSFAQAGADMLYADFYFALKIPLKIKRLSTLRFLASIIMPTYVANAPMEKLYPVGDAQNEIVPKHAELYRWADIIAGDFNFIRKHMPSNLEGKGIVANTTREHEIQELSERKAAYLVTTTPLFNGESFGTNVIEALICAYVGKNHNEISIAQYNEWLEKLKITPGIMKFS